MSRSHEQHCVSRGGYSGLSDTFAALEAARLTSTAEPDALTPAVMSGGAEPAGAAKPSPESARPLVRTLTFKGHDPCGPPVHEDYCP